MKDKQESPKGQNRFNISFLNDLQEYQDKFAEYFNVSSIIFDNDGRTVTSPSGFSKFCSIIQKAKAEGRLSSDPTKTIDDIHTKSCAFFSDIAETIIPITYNGKTISTWAVAKNTIKDIPRDEIDGVAEQIGANADDLWNELQNIPVTTQDEFDRAVYFLHTTISTLMKMRDQDEELSHNLAQFEKITKITAHEMREHLRTILGFIDLLDGRYRSKNDEEFDTFLYYIKDSGNKLKATAELLMDACERDD